MIGHGREGMSVTACPALFRKVNQIDEVLRNNAVQVVNLSNFPNILRYLYGRTHM